MKEELDFVENQLVTVQAVLTYFICRKEINIMDSYKLQGTQLKMLTRLSIRKSEK